MRGGIRYSNHPQINVIQPCHGLIPPRRRGKLREVKREGERKELGGKHIMNAETGAAKGKRQKDQEEAEISGACLTSLIAAFNKLG